MKPLRDVVIQEFDGSVGEILAALDRLNLTNETIVIVTSDNGGVMDDGYQDGSGNDTSGHRCNGILRGFKVGLYEGGHRVPFIIRWPGHIPHGTSDDLICLVDMPATFASLTKLKLPLSRCPGQFQRSALSLWAAWRKPPAAITSFSIPAPAIWPSARTTGSSSPAPPPPRTIRKLTNCTTFRRT